MGKLGGVGLTNIIVIWLICSLLTLLAKTIVLKYDLPDSVQAVVTAS